MKKKLLLLSALFCFAFSWAQKDAAKWKASVEPRRVFIENKGQFDLLNGDAHGKVLYATDGHRSVVLFTQTGLTYRMEMPHKDIEDLEEHLEGCSANNKIARNYYERELEQAEQNELKHQAVVNMEWAGANKDAQLVADGQVPDYFNYQLAASSVNGAHGYSTLTYKNLYNNIDVVYTFHADSGIEYTLIVHPGGDVSQVKMHYTGADGMLVDGNLNIHIKTVLGDIIDRKPVSYPVYNDGRLNREAAKVASSFKVQQSDVFFSVADYDHTQTLIIDPWTTTPAMPRSNRAYYIKTDSTGNAYVYGGDTPFTLEKFNSSGTLQWSYNTGWDSSSYWFGALIVDRAGNSYITNGTGGTLAKINTAGTKLWAGTNNSLGGVEYWTMDFNCDQTQLVIGGMKGLTGYIFNMDLTTGAATTSKQVAKTYLDTTWIPILNIPFSISDPNEIRALTFSPNGNFYFMTPDTFGSITPGFGFNYEIPSGFRWPYYLPYSEGGTGQGQNSMRATLDYVYTTDGEVLQRRNIGTGAIIDSVQIPGGTYQMNSGLAVDTCGNVYVGSQNKVIKYTGSLTYVTEVTTPAAVYDISIGANGDVMACGQSFAAAYAMSACPQLRPICITTLNASLQPTNPVCGGQCTGSASASTTNGTGPYSYLWSNGGTTQTISNLCAGIYNVTVTDQSNGNTANASTTITAPAVLTASVTPTAATCGNSNGSATATITGATGATYAWSNGASGKTISGVAAGSYTVTVTSSTGGCTATATTTIASTGSLMLTPSSTATTCGGSNGQASVTVTGSTGTNTYAWSNGGTAASISNVAPGNYTVTVTGNGCSASSSASVGASTGVVLSSPAVSATTCGNTNGAASISVSSGTGPYSYAWSNGISSAGISDIASGNYTVTVTGAGGCSATASASVAGSTSISLSTTGGQAGCTSTGTVSVSVTTGTGPFTYAWSNGGTTASIAGLSTGTYVVTVTGLNQCQSTASAAVISNGTGLTLTTHVVPATCTKAVGIAGAAVSAGTGPYTYVWNTGATSDTLHGLTGGTYTVTVTGAGGCSATASVLVNTIGAMQVNVASNGTTCGASNGTLTAIALGHGPYTYTWSNGATTDSISNLAAGTYTVTIVGPGTCTDTLSEIVNSSGTSVSINTAQNSICQGDTTQICAPGGFQSYHWNIGDTGQCINATAAGNYYVTVSDNGNCTATSNHVAITVNTPTAVTITMHDDTLRASAANGYQWYIGNMLITGATSSIYIATQSGVYTVKATDNNGCVATSNGETVKGTVGIAQLTTDNYIKVYPNPLSSGGWHIEVSTDWVGSNCNVYDAEGRLVYHTELKSAQTEIDLNVAQGIYLMRVDTEQQTYTIKLIKL